MPKLFEADVLPPEGTLQPRGGTLVVNRARNQGYAEKYRQMRAAGIKIPLFWGHQMKRDGPFHVDDKATERARWQAGDLEAFRVDPQTGLLRTIAEVPPGCDLDPETKTLIDPINHTRHSRVSVGIGDWQDGTGKWWNDVPVHVAITPLPVWVWQDGFREVGGEHLLACSADSRVRVRYVLGGTMPATMKKPGVDEDEEDTLSPEAGGDEPEPEADADEAAAPDEAQPPAGEQPPEAGAADGAPEDPMADAEQPTEGEPELGDMPGEEGAEGETGDPEIDALVEQLGQLGVPGLEGMNAENCVPMLSGVIGGLLAAGAKISVGGEHDLQPGGERPHAESPPMFMLSTGEPTPTGMTDREWALAQKYATNRKDDLRKRCEALTELGLPADIVGRVRERATRFHLSADGDVSFPDVEHDLTLLEEVGGRVGPLLKAALSTKDPEAKVPGNPARGGNPDPADDEYRAWLDQQAERSHGPGAKAGTPKISNP